MQAPLNSVYAELLISIKLSAGSGAELFLFANKKYLLTTYRSFSYIVGFIHLNEFYMNFAFPQFAPGYGSGLFQNFREARASGPVPQPVPQAQGRWQYPTPTGVKPQRVALNYLLTVHQHFFALDASDAGLQEEKGGQSQHNFFFRDVLRMALPAVNQPFQQSVLKDPRPEVERQVKSAVQQILAAPAGPVPMGSIWAESPRSSRPQGIVRFTSLWF